MLKSREEEEERERLEYNIRKMKLDQDKLKTDPDRENVINEANKFLTILQESNNLINRENEDLDGDLLGNKPLNYMINVKHKMEPKVEYKMKDKGIFKAKRIGIFT